MPGIDANRTWVSVPDPETYAPGDLIAIGPMVRRVASVRRGRLYFDRPTEIAWPDATVVRATSPYMQSVKDSHIAAAEASGELTYIDCDILVIVNVAAKLTFVGCHLPQVLCRSPLRCEFRDCMIGGGDIENADLSDCIVQGSLTARNCTLKRVRRGKIAAEACDLRHVGSEVYITGSYTARGVPRATIDPQASGVNL